MNNRQKEVQRTFLESEKDTLNNLTRNYEQALKDINVKLAKLQKSIDKIKENYKEYLNSDVMQSQVQSKIYQQQYQLVLKKQIEDILSKMRESNYDNISDYLNDSYENGYIGTMYDLAGQGIPITAPIDQKQVTSAIKHDTKLSESLYTRLGKDTKVLSRQIAGEISRGIATGRTYEEISRGLSEYADISKNKAMRIARTEGHRIQCQATSDAQYKARDKGADVLKQWNSALDSRTRASHRQLNNQLRELDKPFNVNGHDAMIPGAFDIPFEDINCRCALLQRARWAMSDEELQVLKDEAKDNGLDEVKNFSEYKERMSSLSGNSKWPDKGEKISTEEYKEIMKLAREKGIDLSGFKHFDGNINTIEELIHDAESVASKYPEIKLGNRRLTLKLDNTLNEDDFAVTNGHIVSINANAFRNTEILTKEYAKLANEGWFVKDTDYHSIVKHEIGHVVANKYHIDGLSIAEQITGKKGALLMINVKEELSEYATAYKNGQEIIAESFASAYGENPNSFALKFIEECGKLIT